MYEPLETSKCEKCGKIIAEPKELIRIRKGRGFLPKLLTNQPKNVVALERNRQSFMYAVLRDV